MELLYYKCYNTGKTINNNNATHIYIYVLIVIPLYVR